VAELTVYQLIWIVTGSIVGAGWLICSFSDPSPRRAILEWFCASAMYVGLLSLFVMLLQRARESDNTFALVAFGFLCVMFGGGLLVSLWHTISSMGGPKQTGPTLTN